MDERDYLAEFEASLIGRSCAIGRREYDWTFDLKGDTSIAVNVPWRILSKGRIAFAAADDGQFFGRTSPLDGEAEAHAFLRTKSVTSVVIDRQTADIALHFDDETRIDVFNNSSGYEGWQATFVVDGIHWTVIAKGGGELAFFDRGA